MRQLLASWELAAPRAASLRSAAAASAAAAAGAAAAASVTVTGSSTASVCFFPLSRFPRSNGS